MFYELLDYGQVYSGSFYILRISQFPSISQHFPAFPGISQNFPAFPGISQNFPAFLRISQNSPDFQEFTGIVIRFLF